MKTLLLFLNVGVIFCSQGQGIVEQISNCVGIISFLDKSNPGTQNIGTGTFMIRTYPNNKAFAFIVTNRHVLPTPIQNDSIHFRIRDGKSFIDFRILIFTKNGGRDKEIKEDPDGNDLVLINVSNIFKANPQLTRLLGGMIDYRMLLPKDSIRNRYIEVGDEILFIGYPNLFFDKRNFSPIVRTGIIATSPADDFYFSNELRSNHLAKFKELLPEKLNGFLIDANVFQGSSGSLIFTRPRFFRAGKDGKLQFLEGDYGEVLLLGVLTTSYLDISPMSNQRVQLGGVISASQIIRTMDLFKP